MSPLGRQWPRLVCLLTVLWEVGRTGADQPPPPADAGTSPDPDLLLNLIVNEVVSVVQPLVGKLTTRIDRLDSRLIDVSSRLTGIETRLNTLDFSHDSVNSRLDELVSRVDTVNGGLGSTLEELASRADFMERMFSSRLKELISHTNSTDSRLDSRVDEVVAQMDRLSDMQNSRLDNVTSRLEEQSSHLDNVTSRLDQQSSRLDNVTSHLDQESCRLVSLANLTALDSPHDCSELPTWLQSGVYRLQLSSSLPAVPAYCDLDTEGRWWTVIQRRADIQPRQDFYRYWSDYRQGFGDLNKEFWWGLEKVWQMTGATGHPHQLRIELADFDGERRHALYGRFSVSSEADGYRLSVGDYSGNAGDSLAWHSGMQFSTRDKEQDRWSSGHCAQERKGAWWFKYCSYSHLNGQYLPGKREKTEGVYWEGWRGWSYSLKETVMKIRSVTTD